MNQKNEQLVELRNTLLAIAGGILLAIAVVLLTGWVLVQVLDSFPEMTVRILVAALVMIIIAETIWIVQNHHAYGHGIQDGIQMVTEFHAHTVKTMRTTTTTTIPAAPPNDRPVTDWMVDSSLMSPEQRAAFFQQILESQGGRSPLSIDSPPPPDRPEKPIRSSSRRTTSPSPTTVIEVGRHDGPDIIDG